MRVFFEFLQSFLVLLLSLHPSWLVCFRFSLHLQIELFDLTFVVNLSGALVFEFSLRMEDTDLELSKQIILHFYRLKTLIESYGVSYWNLWSDLYNGALSCFSCKVLHAFLATKLLQNCHVLESTLCKVNLYLLDQSLSFFYLTVQHSLDLI